MIKILSAKSEKFLRDQSELNPDMIESLKNYTGFGFDRINKILRDTKGNIDRLHEKDRTRQDISRIDSLFALVDPITEPMTLYRGVRLQQHTEEDYGFVSTSYDIAQAMYYAGATCCLMEINIPVGTKCIFLQSISSYDEEKEVLLPRNGKFVVTSVALSKNPSEKDRYFVTFIPSNAVEVKTLSAAVASGDARLKTLEKAIEKVEKKHLPSPKSDYSLNEMLYSNSSEG